MGTVPENSFDLKSCSSDTVENSFNEANCSQAACSEQFLTQEQFIGNSFEQIIVVFMETVLIELFLLKTVLNNEVILC